MADVGVRFAQAAEHLDVRWGDADTELAMLGVEQRRRRRVAARAGAGTVAVLALVVGLWSSRAPLVANQPGRAAGPVTFASGVRATRLGPDARFEVITNDRAEDTVAVTAGSVRFDVKPGFGRFEVHAGAMRVEVVGTSFSVRRHEKVSAVTVEEGIVLVHWRGDTTRLLAGESRTFRDEVVPPVPAQPATPVAAPTPSPEPSGVTNPAKAAAYRPAAAAPQATDAQLVSPSPTPMPAAPATTAPTAPPPSTWKELTRQGRHRDAANELLRPEIARAVAGVDDLMLAADVMRLAGMVSGAVPFLDRVARDHAEASTAPLAAFTMGRILLNDLSQPTEAAIAFERCRALRPTGAMAEDALAREVEAWSKAGQSDRAALRANEFLKLYPQSTRKKVVERWGGLQ